MEEPVNPDLFDPIKRTRMGHARRTESLFEFWNTSARPDIEALRSILEEWFSRYPEAHAAELRHRFRSTDDLVHRSALFELYVHEQLHAGGLGVTCHPPISGTDKTPDFLASQADSPRLYVECVLAAQDKKKTARERLQDEVLDAIDELESADFLVEVVIHGQPTGSLPIGRTQLAPRLDEWLRGHDADLVAKEFKAAGPVALPTWTWKGAGVSLVFTALPKKARARGQGQRLIGLQADGIASVMRIDDMIEGAIRKKATRYGELGLPYFIAINVLEFPVDEDDVGSALESAWGTAVAPKNRRVTGVLLATIWNALSASRHPLQVVLNPNATHPSTQPLPFPEFKDALEH